MRTKLLFILLFASYSCFAQAAFEIPLHIDTGQFTNHSKILSHKQISPSVWYVDSVRFDFDVIKYIDPNEIYSYNIVKNAKDPTGAIWVILKTRAVLQKIIADKYLTLNEAYRSHIMASYTSKPIIYVLNNELLLDTARVRIPSKCLVDVKTVNASGAPYFKNILPDALFVLITTDVVSSKPKTTKRIMIR